MRWLDGITDSMDMGLGGLWDLAEGMVWFLCGPENSVLAQDKLLLHWCINVLNDLPK